MQITLMTLALLSGLVLAVGAVFTSLALKNAPDGHEDENGFHYGLANAQPAAVQTRRVDTTEAAWSHSAEREEAHHAVLV